MVNIRSFRVLFQLLPGHQQPFRRGPIHVYQMVSNVFRCAWHTMLLNCHACFGREGAETMGAVALPCTLLPPLPAQCPRVRRTHGSAPALAVVEREHVASTSDASAGEEASWSRRLGRCLGW